MLMMDAIEAQAMLRLQISLRSVSSLLALHNQPLSDMQFGFCALAQTAKDVSLQVCASVYIICMSGNSRSTTRPCIADVIAAPAF